MILVDLGVVHKGKVWCHMASDLSFAELHAFAKRLGLKRSWFDGDHYDLQPAMRQKAVAAGAISVSSKELLFRMVGPRGDRIRACVSRRP